MNIILVRHGKKVESLPDSEAPLAAKGIEQIKKLKDRLEQLRIRPEICFTSKFKRAEQTAEILASVYPIDALTPAISPPASSDLSSKAVLSNIIDDAKKAGVEPDQQVTIAIVGHEPQLGQLVAFLTSTPVKAVDVGKAVWVKVASWSDCLDGKGKIQERF